MNTFPSVRIEGGLLAPDTLEQLLTAELPGQRASDFGLAAQRNLTDEIAAVFADARALWGVFQNRLARLPETDPATTATRDLWMIPFFELLGYELKYNPRAHEIDGATFAISHRAGADEAAPPVHIVGARQELGRVAASGRPRLSPHALLQEYLNRSEHLWGMVSNGQTLRLLRDSTFVRRQAYVEFDLAAIFDEARFQDFAVLYRLLHRSRLPRGLTEASGCLLEQYYQRALEQGGRVRERLREGVEVAIERLANGFLSATPALRGRLAPTGDGKPTLAAEELYRQLLRLVYRFLFLLVSEERGLISAHALYRQHYGIARLRRLLDRRSAYDDHDDLWQSLRVLWRLFADENLARFLGVAPLNGELFAPLDLDAATIANRDLLTAFWPLAYWRESERQPWRRVNYAALDVEELGSVYESLLEFHPTLEQDAAGRLAFRLIPGAERKTTGSYYTPPALVHELVESALEPLLTARMQTTTSPQAKERALLSIKVCDPACGSGHFLLAAARRLGKALAQIRTGEDEPAPERLREAVRDVIAHCIYGVDKNPLAVELCRVALWLEGHTGGKPLTFLDHRIRCGDSLIGVFDLERLKEGIPDAAFAPLEGDARDAAQAAKRLNRAERDGEDLTRLDLAPLVEKLRRQALALEDLSDDTPQAVREKKRRYEALQADAAWQRLEEACHLWTAAFYQPLAPRAPIITARTLADHLAGRADPQRLALAQAIASRERFFHWPLEFPEVFAAGGFDAILSNPPWERIKLQEQEFFAARDARIAAVPTKAARADLIRALPETQPALYAEYLQALRSAAAASQFLRHGGRYPLTGRGDINTYAVFAELARGVLKPGGRAGIVVPTGIATDDTTKYFFQDLVRAGALASLYDFENRRGLFPEVHRSYKFCLLTLRAPTATAAPPAEFVFFALAPEDLRRPEKRFTLSAEEIALINPNTGNCPIFRSQADAELTKAIYRRVPVLWREARAGAPEHNPWRLSFKTLFHMANDSHHFRTAAELEAAGYRREGNVFVRPAGSGEAGERYLPLYEAKMLHQFDHRWATYVDAEDTRDVTEAEKRDPRFVAQPRYWVRQDIVEAAIPKYPEPLAAAIERGAAEDLGQAFALWAAGHDLVRGDADRAAQWLAKAHARGTVDERAQAERLARDYPLDAATLAQVEAAAAASGPAEAGKRLAAALIERFSPKWFLGWRDICRSTDERTTISSALPRVAAGDTILLMFPREPDLQTRLTLVAALNSFVQDYAARQKVGGTHMKYNVFRQLPILSPHSAALLPSWTVSAVLELIYTAHDLAPLARDLGDDGPPFPWDPERRFELRCELDAAFFHLYLPADDRGQWRPARVADGHVVDETPAQLAALKAHFPTPRDAVAYILEQFPILRQKEEARFGHYRTQARILAIYDAMLAAQASGRPYASPLDPPPGERR